MFCPRCGVALPDQSAFCNACGAPTGVPPVARRGFRPSFVIRLAVGALVLFLLWSVFSKDKQPDSSLPHEQEHVRAVERRGFRPSFVIRLAVGALVLFLLWSVFSKDKQPDSSLPHEQEHVRAV